MQVQRGQQEPEDNMGNRGWLLGTLCPNFFGPVSIFPLLSSTPLPILCVQITGDKLVSNPKCRPSPGLGPSLVTLFVLLPLIGLFSLFSDIAARILSVFTISYGLTHGRLVDAKFPKLFKA